MSNDKRTVQTDALDSLGTIIDSNEKRDAIHLAVEPVIAGEDLSVGEDVSVVNGEAISGWERKDTLGIVDPFLKQSVKKGQRFWLVIYPRKITSLRHVWSHPDLPEFHFSLPEESQEPINPTDGTTKQASKIWITHFASSAGMSYERMMGAADRWHEYEDYTNMGENEDYKNVWGSFGEFWTHWEIVTGRDAKKAKEEEASFFSCSC